MDTSTYCLQQLLFLACLACGLASGLITYGTITPQSPEVEIGKNFTATCVLYKAAEATAADVIWTCNEHQVPEEQYTKINDSAVSVTIQITPDTCKWLICKKKPRFENQSTSIHGIILTKGYPPEKPNRLSCIAVQSNRRISPIVTCTWEPGTRDERLITKYTLHANYSDNSISNISQRSIGHLNTKTFPSFCDMEIWVEVTNSLGKVQSDILKLFDANDLVKTDPPSDVHIISENNFPRSLLVKWKRPIDKYILHLKYNICFCAVGSEDWHEVPEGDMQVDIESFRLQHLRPYTEYLVKVRCIQNTGQGYWSGWSSSKTRWTPEDEPSSPPDLWRVISSQNTSGRMVQVVCKDPVESNGRIRNYSIKVRGEDWKIVPVNRSELESRSQERTITLLHQFVLADDNESVIELDACNSRGKSPRASMTVPKLTREPPSVKSLRWFTKEGRLWVEWEPPTGRPRDVTEYILEWVLVSNGTLDWQRERKNQSLAGIRGNLEKFKRYNISVYPMYSGKPGRPRTEAAFLEENAPVEGPFVKVRRNGKNEVELEWMEIPLDKRRGFITNYTIFYTTGTQENAIVVPPETYSYSLKRLTARSKYVVKVMASTVVGSAFGPEYTFNTLEFAPGEIEGIVVSVCLAFLFVVVSLVVFCILKMERIKKKIWPPVPDPSNSTIANWSPDFPSKADPVSKETALGDVSVVEVDALDGRSLCEEDKAGLPLRKDKFLSEEHSSGIGGSSCMSSPRQSVSDSDEGGDSGQTTASTVQYSSVVAAPGGYKGQTPQAPTPSFARSESTQPLLEGEEQPEGREGGVQPRPRPPRNTYFRRSPGGGSDDDEDRGGEPGRLEMEEPGLNLLRFSPLEEGSRQTTPTEEGQSPDGQPGPAPSYLPQQRGYRPQ